MNWRVWLLGDLEATRLDAVRAIVNSPPPLRTGSADPKRAEYAVSVHRHLKDVDLHLRVRREAR